MIPSIVVSVLYAYNADFAALTLDATLVIAVTFFGTSIAATILPWWKPEIFDNSPIAHHEAASSAAPGDHHDHPRLGPSSCGCPTRCTAIGVGNTTSILFLGAVYGVAALLYIVARLYRRSQGVDLDAIHSEIPVRVGHLLVSDEGRRTPPAF